MEAYFKNKKKNKKIKQTNKQIRHKVSPCRSGKDIKFCSDKQVKTKSRSRELGHIILRLWTHIKDSEKYHVHATP